MHLVQKMQLCFVQARPLSSLVEEPPVDCGPRHARPDIFVWDRSVPEN